MPLNMGRLRKWSLQIRKEKGNKCALCGSEPDGAFYKRIEVHHIEPKDARPDLIYDVRNGIPLCRCCHKYIHSSVWGAFDTSIYGDFWAKKYQEKKKELIDCSQKHGWAYPADPPLLVI